MRMPASFLFLAIRSRTGAAFDFTTETVTPSWRRSRVPPALPRDTRLLTGGA
jgi:hypothetical protein